MGSCTLRKAPSSHSSELAPATSGDLPKARPLPRLAGCSQFQLLQIVHVQELQWANSDSEDDDDDDDSEDLCGPQTIQSDHSGF